MAAIRRAFAALETSGFRVLHYSVQRDHLHLLVEADAVSRFTRGVQGLAIRLAKAINRVVGRHERVWGDRYHARLLRTPREVRHALVYVLNNARKHLRAVRGFDPCSSAAWSRCPATPFI
jgi:REP element-mobilizing transposase RayT